MKKRSNVTWHPTIGQRVDVSDNGWTGAGGPRRDPSPYLAETGYTAEDWNFAKRDVIADPLGGGEDVLLGFGQGRVRPTRRSRASRLRGAPLFDVCFFTLEEDACWVHGVYTGARYLTDEEVRTVWRSLAWRPVRDRREAELRAVLGDGAEKTVRRFRKDSGVRWMVRLEDVLVLDEPVRVRPPKQADRYSNALDWSRRPWWEWLQLPQDVGAEEVQDAPSTIEGRVRIARHLRRERDPGFAALVKARRLAAAGHLACECCGVDLGRVYGPGLQGFIEGHHVRPLHTLAVEGEAVAESDIVLLCPTCHRVAHRTERVALVDLKALLQPGWTFAHPERP